MCQRAAAIAEDDICRIEVDNYTASNFTADVTVNKGDVITINGKEADNAEGQTYKGYDIEAGDGVFVAEMQVSGHCGFDVTVTEEGSGDTNTMNVDATDNNSNVDCKDSSGFLKTYGCKCNKNKGDHHAEIILTCQG